MLFDKNFFVIYAHYFTGYFRFLIKTYKDGGLENSDIHWRPQVLLCHPCRFQYSYVIRFENLVVESNRLLDYVQTHNMLTKLSEKIKFPEKKTVATTNSVTTDTMQLISEDLVEELREIYADDFRFYGYDPYQYKGG